MPMQCWGIGLRSRAQCRLKWRHQWQQPGRHDGDRPLQRNAQRADKYRQDNGRGRDPPGERTAGRLKSPGQCLCGLWLGLINCRHSQHYQQRQHHRSQPTVSTCPLLSRACVAYMSNHCMGVIPQESILHAGFEPLARDASTANTIAPNPHCPPYLCQQTLCAFTCNAYTSPCMMVLASLLKKKNTKKNRYIFSSQLRADQMPGPPREGQLLCTPVTSTRPETEQHQ